MTSVKLLDEQVVNMGEFKVKLKLCESHVNGTINQHLMVSEWDVKKGKWRLIETIYCEKKRGVMK